MRVRNLTLGLAALGLAACGGSDSTTGGGQGCLAVSTVNITSTGISPLNVCVQPGGQVAFANKDTASTHDIEFDTTGCPAVGNISPGGQVTATFPTTVICAFHDGKNPGNAAFIGNVAVASTPPAGGGY